MNKVKLSALIYLVMILLFTILLSLALAACGSDPSRQFDQAHQDSYNFLQSELQKSETRANSQPYINSVMLHRHDGSRISCDAIMRDLGAAANPNNYQFSEVQRLKTEYNTYCRQWR
jgi:hypothetical protein